MKISLTKKQLDHIHSRQEKAKEEWTDLQQRLSEDKTGPKIGDIFIAKPGTYKIPRDCEVDMDVYWAVIKVHPDNEKFIYIVPYDVLGCPFGDTFDVVMDYEETSVSGRKETYQDAILRIGAGAWVDVNRFSSFCHRVLYLEQKWVDEAQISLSDLVCGKCRQPIDDPEVEERVDECIAMARELATACEPIRHD